MNDIQSGTEVPVDVVIDATGAVSTAPPTDQTEERTGLSRTPAGDDNDLEDLDHQEVDNPDATEEERADIRSRRKEERTRRKTAARAREEGQRRLIAQQQQVIEELSGRVAAVERTGLSTHINHVDAAIADTVNRLAEATQAHAHAVSLGDGMAAAEAVELMMDLRMRKVQLDGNKRQLARAVQEQPRGSTTQQPPQQAPTLPASVQSRAAAFVERNKDWYNPAGNNAESKLVIAVDQEVAEDGFDPSTDEYWQEVDSRLKKYLPHRIKQAHTSARSEGNSLPSSPVSGSSRSQASGRGGTTIYTLSADRVAAMKESGAWDDPKRKADQIKRFQTYDAEQKGGAK
jgi:hypothetical protein